jgi:RNA polymerase sigma factor (sigma-70 family)
MKHKFYDDCPVLSKEEEYAAWERKDYDLLIRSQLPFVVTIAVAQCKRFGFRNLEDAISEGNLALVRCVQEAFDASKGYRLTTYCQWTVWRCIRKFIFASFRLPIENTQPAETPIEQPDTLESQEELEQLRQAMEKLQPKRKQVIRHILDEKSMIEIGQIMGCTRQNVHVLTTRAICELRASMN